MTQRLPHCYRPPSSSTGEHAKDGTDHLPARHKLTVDDYYRMAEAGILGEDDHVELIDGDIIDMAPIGQGHAATVNKLNRALVMAFGDLAIVSVQNPVRLNQFNEPQADFAVFRPVPISMRRASGLVPPIRSW